jgi:glutamyl-tRNA synthetase
MTWLSESAQNIRAELFEFDNLINKEKLEEGEDFKDFINEDNLASMFAVCDANIKNLKKDDVIQIERRGLYRCDKVYGGKGEGKEIKLFMIPDGKTKAMSTLSTKLDHR